MKRSYRADNIMQNVKKKRLDKTITTSATTTADSTSK